MSKGGGSEDREPQGQGQTYQTLPNCIANLSTIGGKES